MYIFRKTKKFSFSNLYIDINGVFCICHIFIKVKIKVKNNEIICFGFSSKLIKEERKYMYGKMGKKMYNKMGK
jgi:hypothetical protein